MLRCEDPASGLVGRPGRTQDGGYTAVHCWLRHCGPPPLPQPRAAAAPSMACSRLVHPLDRTPGERPQITSRCGYYFGVIFLPNVEQWSSSNQLIIHVRGEA